MTPPEDASPQRGDLLLGNVIAGNFRIERLIGAGAMGNVYQAEQISLGKAVAVKVLHAHLMGDEKLVRRFQREAKSASRLNHPNSIQIIDSGQDASGTLYIAMELLSGRDLAQVIRDEFPLPVPRIVRIMSQVLSALDEAHVQGVIHRDLKPSNIMLIERRGEPDFVKVCDYGIAKAQVDDGQSDAQMLTIQGLVCGTPEYMSPEQARGEPLDGRADLYSAAVILYHLVTGDIPFRAATPIGIVSRHLSEAPAVPSARRQDPGIPADLDDLILRGLAKTRELRPASAAVFREELENIGSGRLGRRARAVENTVPASVAVNSGGPTTQIPIVLPAARRLRSGRTVVIALFLSAALAAVTLAVIRRAGIVRPPALASAVTSPPAPSAPENNVAPAPEPIPPATPDPVAPANANAPAAGPDRSQRTAGSPRNRVASRRHNPVSAGTAPPTGPPPPAASKTIAPAGEATTAPVAEEKSAGIAAGAKSPRELVGEAEKLLAQGDVAEACRRGEEAKKAAPRLAPSHKFLGKCYMRAGDPGRAKENYRRYLDLHPGASDAVFIESILK